MILGSILIATAGSFLLPGSNATAFESDAPGSQVVFSTPLIVGLLAIWIVGFALIIVYSGGLPVVWALTGVDRYYYDYGIPTFSGAWNTFRVVIAVLAAIAAVRAKSFSWVPIGIVVFMTLTVLAEINRGGYLLYCLNLLAAGGLMAPKLKRQLAWIAIVVLAMLGGVVSIGTVRSTDPKAATAISAPFIVEKHVELLDEPYLIADKLHYVVSRSPALSWIYLYLTSPVANLYQSATETPAMPPFPGFYSLYPFLPSVIRPDLPPETRNPVPLASQSYTMSSAYSTLIADFGFVGASIAIGLQLLLGVWIYNLARRHVFAQILLPMFFAISVLSFFTNYFLTLLTPFHAFLAVFLGIGVPRIWAGTRNRLLEDKAE